MIFLMFLALQGAASSSPHNLDLLALAQKRHPLGFEDILRGRFDVSRHAEFEALRTWSERPTPEELAEHYERLPGEKAFYRELTPCWEADLKGRVRSMVVAASTETPKQARSIWSKVDAVFRDGLALERKSRASAVLEARSRPTPFGKELAVRAALDQVWRKVQNRQDFTDAESEVLLWRAWSRTCHIASENVAFMKNQIAVSGWPTISHDGSDAVHDAFLIVQHADDDPGFQTSALQSMEPYVKRGEISGSIFAALFDRVALAGGKPQRYGTQFSVGKKGCTSARPIEDPEKVDERRASVGLPSLAKYGQTLAEAYKIKMCSDVLDSDEKL